MKWHVGDFLASFGGRADVVVVVVEAYWLFISWRINGVIWLKPNVTFLMKNQIHRLSLENTLHFILITNAHVR